MSAEATEAWAAAAPAPQVGAGIADHDGVWLAWREFGEGDPILLLMGFMGSGRAWYRLLPHLAGPSSPSPRRAVTMDNRGTGESDRPLGLWTMDDFAGDALAVMDAAGLESAHVVGASMGGMIAQHLALGHPERVRSLTLACTHPGGQPGGLPWRMLASLALRPFFGPDRTFSLVAPLLYSERTRSERRHRLAEDLEMRFQDSTPVATAPAQASAIFGHDTRRRLRDLAMPVLVVHGAEDALVPPSAAEELARLIPGARLEIIPRCGHILTTDAEEEAAAAILGFLDSL